MMNTRKRRTKVRQLLRSTTLKKLLTFVISVTVGLLFTTHLQAGEEVHTPLDTQIPNEANVIVLEQESTVPAEMYLDALQYMQRAGFKVTHSENTVDPDSLTFTSKSAPLTFSVEKQLDENLALRINYNVNAIPGGSELVARAEYTENISDKGTQWNEAQWTHGKAKKAFYTTLQSLREATYDKIYFETRVMTAQK